MTTIIVCASIVLMKAADRPMATIIDIVNKIPGSRSSFTDHQYKIIRRVRECRTSMLGVYEYKCENESCGHIEYRYVSCKHRACSVCSWLPREKWKLQRENDMIPDCPYYHNVFTIPYDMSAIASQNQVVMQNLLMKSVSATLKEFGESHFGEESQIGFMLVLHTWSTRMTNHYHIHAAIPGGYLFKDKWYQRDNYLFPAKALAQVFRAKMCTGIRNLRKNGLLKFKGQIAHLSDKQAFSDCIDKCYSSHWHVHSEVTKGADPSRLVGYLANYVYKTAIDHSRIQSVSEEAVEYQYRSHEVDSKGKWLTQSLAPAEFMRRFASHIQPEKYTRIRYYGFLAGGVKKERLEVIFKQKKKEYKGKNREIHRSSCEAIMLLSGRMEPMKCPICKSRMLTPWEQEEMKNTGPPLPDIPATIGKKQYKVCA